MLNEGGGSVDDGYQLSRTDSHRYNSLVFNGFGTNFGVGIGEARPEEPRAGVGFLGRGQPAPPHQVGGLRER